MGRRGDLARLLEVLLGCLALGEAERSESKSGSGSGSGRERERGG